jgi:GT2 family glycosyltransferase
VSAQGPLVSVVAIAHNSRELFERLLAGLRASDYTPLEILVVDNASIDGTAQALSAEPDVKVLRSEENLGYGPGCNFGAERAQGDLLLFMNPDVGLRPDTISLLVRDLRRTPGAAVVCATTLEPGGSHERSSRVEDVAAMNGTLMLVDRAHFERIGGFDPRIFLYSEDTDLCYRTWLAGRRVLKSWEAVADHDLGGAGGGHRWSAEQIKNGLYVHIKLRSWPATARYAARMAVKSLVRGVARRDPAVLGAWAFNVRELPATLVKRRAVRGAASPADRKLLERLGAEHAYWARRSWRAAAIRRLRARVGGPLRAG